MVPVKKDPSGHRSIEAEVEVPGTPEEVWRAIATGPGITSWFVPSTVEERVGGTATANFGPGMESVATITAWDPPRRFAAETVEEPGTIATEWIVEARSGGTCVVRVVHRWFASSDEWDGQFEGHAEGWQAFFRNLRLYLTYFPGQPSSEIALTGFGPEPKSKAWEALMGRLGLTGTAVGKRVGTGSGAPSLAGVVERVGEDAYPEELLLRLDQPAPGIAHLFAMPMGGQVLLSVRLYLYGKQASAVAAEVEPKWQAWVNQHFPAPGAALPA
jgi:uncharacterized protein YndB with AHSA1/START domain